MTISTIRRAHGDDITRIRGAAARFCTRHGITVYGDEADAAEHEIDAQTDCSDPYNTGARKLRNLWIGVYCRALRQPRDARLTVAFGHVGIRLD
jgi:hypothetical protein